MDARQFANLIEEHSHYCNMTYQHLPDYGEKFSNSLNHFATWIVTVKCRGLK